MFYNIIQNAILDVEHVVFEIISKCVMNALIQPEMLTIAVIASKDTWKQVNRNVKNYISKKFLFVIKNALIVLTILVISVQGYKIRNCRENFHSAVVQEE